MVHCCVKACKNNSRKTSMAKDGITYHSFPKNNSMKEKWITALKRGEGWFPSPSSVVCSAHFAMEDINVSQKGRRRIFHDAIPTLCLKSMVKAKDIEDINSRIPLTPGEHIELTRVKRHSNMQLRRIKVLRSQNVRLRQKVATMQHLLALINKTLACDDQ